MNKEVLLKFYLQYRLYIFPTVVALSSLFLIVFAIYPQTIKLISNQRTESELSNKFKSLEVKAAELSSYNEVDLKRKVNYALTSFPSDKDFGNVVGLLQVVGSQSGYTIASITLGGGTAKINNAQSYSVRVEATGSKDQLSTFLSNIESSTRLMRVNSIEATGKDEQSITLSLMVDVLFSPAPNSFGSADTPLPVISVKDEELLTKLATSIPEPTTTEIIPTGPRGKANPFQ